MSQANEFLLPKTLEQIVAARESPKQITIKTWVSTTSHALLYSVIPFSYQINSLLPSKVFTPLEYLYQVRLILAISCMAILG